MKKYTCPKCHAVVYSDKKPVYCVCGGKYRTIFDDFKNLGFGGLGAEFGGIHKDNYGL